MLGEAAAISSWVALATLVRFRTNCLASYCPSRSPGRRSRQTEKRRPHARRLIMCPQRVGKLHSSAHPHRICGALPCSAVQCKCISD